MDHKKYIQTIESAVIRPDRRYTIVLFEYVNSGINDTIAQIERLPGTTKSIHETLNDIRCMARLHELFIVNENMRLYTRRKIDNSNPRCEELTNVRQVVVAIAPYAFNRPCSISEESDSEMPPLVPADY
jgi:hypothetical protein